MSDSLNLVIIAPDGHIIHRPRDPDAATPRHALCNRVSEETTEAVSETEARRQGYEGRCSHCQVRHNERIRERGDSPVRSPRAAVDHIRSLREGSHE
jgi:hypothetical protein